MHFDLTPDAVCVAAIGEVGNRVFVLQVHDGDRRLTVKCEKFHLASLAAWLGEAVKEGGRPGHLPDDIAVSVPYDILFVVQEFGVSRDDESGNIDLLIAGEDDDHIALTLSREQAGALAIAIVRLVEAGRPLCPLCQNPLGAAGHDCPRTNGFRPPSR
jgi:uncharacterized repeat protein (TIGR03847 family)